MLNLYYYFFTMNRKALIDLDTRVDNCDFGTHETRILNALQTIDVFTLRQLVRCEERQLTNIRFVGKVIIRDIQPEVSPVLAV